MARHGADLISLAFGVLFVGIGLLLVAGGVGALALGWIAPLVALGLGVLLVVAARSMRPDPDELPPDA
jgi:hypothetical protein